MTNANIHAAVEANNAAVGACDMNAILASFEENGVLLAQPGMLAQGMPALRGAFEQFIGMKPQITVNAHDIIQADDIAVHSSTWTMTGLAPDGSAFEHNGFSVVVLRQQADGRWLIVIDNPFGDQLLQKG